MALRTSFQAPSNRRRVSHPSEQGSAQYVVIVQYPIEEEKGSVGSSSLHVKHYPEQYGGAACTRYERASKALPDNVKVRFNVLN